MNGSPTCTAGRFSFKRVIELGRRHRGAVNTVPASLRSHVVHGVADARRRAFDDFVRSCDSQTEHIHEWIAGIAPVETDLAADSRDANRVAVAANARDNAGHRPANKGVIERAEAK